MTRTNDMCLIVLFLFFAATATHLTQGHVLEFTVEPTDTVVEAGQSAMLDCVVQAAQHQSSVLIQWIDKDGVRINNEQYRNQLTNGSLYISNITELQPLTGTYQCIASLPSIGSIISRTATLSIAKLNGFLEEPRNQTVYSGQKAHFACSVDASPPSKVRWRIRWLKDERPLQIDELRMTVLPSGALEIDEVQESDQGWYRCNATGYNSHKLSRGASLTINGDQETAPPSFIAEPRSMHVIEGQNVSLDCAANGNPTPTISWLKDGYTIDMNDLDSRFSLVGSTYSLRITRIKEEDAGTYQCRAENREDSIDRSAMIQVQVPPKFLIKPQDKIEHVSNNVELQCNVTGKPEPKIQWFKNGEAIIHNDYYSNVNGNNLKISGLLVDDSGLFQCFASNAAGNIQAAASLKVIEQGVVADKRKAQKHKQKKFLPQNDEQLHKQRSKLIFDNLKPDMGETAYAHKPRDTDLTRNSKFDAHSAFSSLISSESNDDTNLGDVQPAFSPASLDSATGNAEKKISDGLPGPPLDLKALITKARFIILSWSPPIENREAIEAYGVYYKQEGSQRERLQNSTRPKLEELSLQNLSPGKVYHFRVVAFNRRGAGISSKPLTVTTQSEEHVASAPQQLEAFATGARSIHISWEPPLNPNGDIIKYNLFYMETSGSLEYNFETREHQYELTSLNPYTEYSIWLVAVNINGPGAASEEKVVRTFSDVPSEPPTNITLEPGSTSLLVRWEPPPPESQNGIILGYKIKYRKESRKPVTIQTQAKMHHVTLNNLEKGTLYMVRIWALNINGTSPPSEWIEATTYKNDMEETKVPDKPAYIKVRSMSDVLYVMWAPPIRQNTRIRNYILGWGKGVPDMYTTELHENNRTYIIKNLDANSEYVLSIRASNQMGTGPPTYTTVRTQDEPIPEPPVLLMPPIGLKAHVITPQSVVLYWTDPSLKSQVVKDNRVYVIKYTAEKSSKNKFENTSDLNFMIDDLKPNTVYEFSVKLIKGTRESPWSMVVTNKTFELPPNVAPRDLDVHFKDEENQIVELTWQPPKTTSGKITGYVILYTENKTRSDREWHAIAIKGDNHSSVIYDLKPVTLYYFKVQARNSRGYGPFSGIVSFRTGQNVATYSKVHNNIDSQGIFSKSFLLYLLGVGCFIAVATVAGVVIFLCCRKKDPATTSPDRSKKGYQKGNQNIKPPDLWIHHDQMELKAEKRHSNNDGASSSGAMTLPRSVGGNDYDNHDSVHTNSLDKRNYAPGNYGAIATPINTATLSQSSSDSTPSSRPSYQRTQYSLPRSHVQSDTHAISNTPTIEQMYSGHPGHATYETNTPTAGYINQPPVAHVPPGSTYAPGMNIMADQAAKRAQGQGHPLKSFTVPAPPPISAPGTPQAKHIVTVRPNSSPFKKAPTSGSTSTLTGTPPSRISASNPPPHTPEEVQRLNSSHSTEELNQEMANLEGLMLTLNAITANEFEC
ncbi:neogenin isoform X2 [Aethina tumida]|uniref:neogenin isoform X2 n=1 Tax=Aethina tumida TaxID=116153 RepID=UPI0021477C0C|nr:neogenin isoform X2 [Aethina tumida]